MSVRNFLIKLLGGYTEDTLEKYLELQKRIDETAETQKGLLEKLGEREQAKRDKAIEKKTCKDCGQEKDVSHFWTHKKTQDGLDPRCKECKTEQQRQRRKNKTSKKRNIPRPQSHYTRYKVCARCQSIKRFTEFNINRKSSDGVSSWCKECNRERSRELQETKKNPSSDHTSASGLNFKACVRCGETKSLEEFYQNKRTKDGKNSWCKRCITEYNHQRRKNNKKVSMHDEQIRQGIRIKY